MSLIKLKLKEEITYTLPYYFIGQSIITEDINFNPNKIFIGQKWERDMQGYAIVGLKENDNDFGTINKKVGAKTHKLTISEMPEHRHTDEQLVGSYYGSNKDWAIKPNSNFGDSRRFVNENYVGQNQPHNNIQPSQVKIIWTRKA